MRWGKSGASEVESSKVLEESQRRKKRKKEGRKERKQLTSEAGVIGLDKSLLDLPILDHKRVPLAPRPAKDGRAVKGQVERLGKLRRGVAEEADLRRRRGLEHLRGKRGVWRKSMFLGSAGSAPSGIEVEKA